MRKTLKKILAAALAAALAITLTPEGILSTAAYGGANNQEVALATDFPISYNTIKPGNLNVSVAISYDNEYFENILMAEKGLTLELTAQNTSADLKMIQFFTGIYDNNDNMVETAYNEAAISAGETKTIAISSVIPKDSRFGKAVVYIWDNLVSGEPWIAFISQPIAADHYGNFFSAATRINDINKIINL